MAKRKAAPASTPSAPDKRRPIPYTLKPHPHARIVYPKPTPEAVRAVLAYYNAAVAHLMAPGDAPVPLPDPKLLLTGLPHGPIRRGPAEDFSGAFPFMHFELAYGGGARSKAKGHTTPAGFLVLRALCLFDGQPFEAGHYGPPDLCRIPVLAEGFTLAGLLAGTDCGEFVALEANGALVPWQMTIKPGRERAGRQRNDAIGFALRRHEKFAAAWGLAGVLSLDGYEALLKGSFRLFDYEHGRHFMQTVEPGLVVDPLG